MTKLLRTVACLEILAGGFMLVDVCAGLFTSHADWPLARGLFVAMGLLGLFAGNALFRSRRRGWAGSLLLQLLQMPVFLLGATLYRPGLGLFIPVGAGLGGSGASAAINEFSLGVDWAVSLHAPGAPQYLAVNVAALACMVILLLNRPASVPPRT